MLRPCAVVVVIALAACSHGGGAPAVQPGAPAGDVREVNGDVHAHRGSDPARALAVGDTVSGDDVVETGGDGSVVIELRHNGARWSLGPGQQKQVSDSLAWSAPSGSAPSGSGDDRTAAAGRHAERTAADTSETASRAPGDQAPVTASAGVPAPDVQPPPRVVQPEEHEHKPERATTGKKSTAHRAPTAAKGNGDAGDDLEPPLGEPTGGGGGGGGNGLSSIGGSSGDVGSTGASVERKVTGRAQVSGDSSGSGGLDTGTIARTLSSHRAALEACYDRALKSDPSIQGTVTMTFTVGTDGKVTDVQVTATDSAGPTLDCVKAQVQRFRFPTATQSTTARGSIVFSVPS